MNQSEDILDHYRIKPDSKVNLSDFDPDETSQFKGSKDDSHPVLLKLNAEFDALQEQLYAEHKHKILVVLQGMDTSGKDGTVRAVFEGVNPQGVHVASFKVPTSEESDHDFLWRIHKETPGKGEIVIFNRSHYEDVLVVRVHNLVPEDVWKKRYDEINAFERQLAAEGTTIIKFFLHIDLAQQKERLLERLDDPAKNWKLSPFDLKERALWDNYVSAYEDALAKTSTDWAPWYIVPANKKWYRNLVISTVLNDTLKKLDIQLPQAMSAADVAAYRKQLLSE